MNNSKTPTITPQNSAPHKRGTINPDLYATGKPAKLRLLEGARDHLAKHGIKQFCLNTVLTNCEISKEQFNDLFGNKRTLIRAVFSDLASLDRLNVRDLRIVDPGHARSHSHPG